MNWYSKKQIVITGASAITSAGIGLDALVSAVCDERRCLVPVPEELVKGRSGCFWGKADCFRATDFIAPLKARKLDRGSQFVTAVTGTLLKEAGLSKDSISPERTGIAIGCGFGGIANAADFLSGYFLNGASGLNPILFPNTVANAPASNASIEFNLKGPNVTHVQRFCSAESAVMMACRFIEEGRADIMFAGGVDELLPLMIHGFDELKQLNSYGMGFGEGTGLLVFESMEHAVARGAKILATLQSIHTAGIMLHGDEYCTASKIIPEKTDFSLAVVSGVEPPSRPFSGKLDHMKVFEPGRFVGRSLAMGGFSLGLLTALLENGATGLHVSASPEGPFFGIVLKGGSPDNS